jgi:hypothetical protein
MPIVNMPMGEPPTRPDGTVTNATSPMPATPATAALASPEVVARANARQREILATSRAADARLPQSVSPHDQARATGARE